MRSFSLSPPQIVLAGKRVDVASSKAPASTSEMIYSAKRRSGPIPSANNIIDRDPEVFHGTPVFCGTRVPLQALSDSLEGVKTLGAFLEGFPGVTGEMVIAAIEEAHQLSSSKV